MQNAIQNTILIYYRTPYVFSTIVITRIIFTPTFLFHS